MEERRKIVEGADALLNLAGIATYSTRKRPVMEEEELTNTKQSCVESSAECERRLKTTTRKEKTLAGDYNACDDAILLGEEDAGESTDTNNKRSYIYVSSYEERTRAQKNRAIVGSNRRLRRKIEKKRFKL